MRGRNYSLCIVGQPEVIQIGICGSVRQVGSRKWTEWFRDDQQAGRTATIRQAKCGCSRAPLGPVHYLL